MTIGNGPLWLLELKPLSPLSLDLDLYIYILTFGIALAVWTGDTFLKLPLPDVTGAN